MMERRVVRLASLLADVDDRGHSELDVLSIYRDLGVVPKASRDDNFNRTPDDLSQYKRVRRGDVVINKMKAWSGSMALSDYDGIVSGDYMVCTVTGPVVPRFLHYLLRSRPVFSEIASRSTGIRPGQWRLYWEDLRDVRVSLPPIDAQRAIADYLDAENVRMDALIERKRKLIELLLEGIDSALRDLIGRSPLVDGGQSLLAVPTRRLLAKQNRVVKDRADVITAFRDGQVTARSRRRTEGFTESWTEGAHVQGVVMGDVVVHGLDGFAGAIGASEADGACSPVYHVCTPTDGGDADFYGRLLRVLAITGYLGNFATSTRERAVDFRNWDLFGRIPIPVVDLADQRRIGDRIRRLRPIEHLVERTELLIAERRQALITAAVTGQVEIPGVAA